MTNREQLRGLTDEQFSRFLAAIQAELVFTVAEKLNIQGQILEETDIQKAADGWLDWLKQEAEE